MKIFRVLSVVLLFLVSLNSFAAIPLNVDKLRDNYVYTMHIEMKSGMACTHGFINKKTPERYVPGDVGIIKSDLYTAEVYTYDNHDHLYGHPHLKSFCDHPEKTDPPYWIRCTVDRCS